MGINNPHPTLDAFGVKSEGKVDFWGASIVQLPLITFFANSTFSAGHDIDAPRESGLCRNVIAKVPGDANTIEAQSTQWMKGHA